MSRRDDVIRRIDLAEAALISLGYRFDQVRDEKYASARELEELRAQSEPFEPLLDEIERAYRARQGGRAGQLEAEHTARLVRVGKAQMLADLARRVTALMEEAERRGKPVSREDAIEALRRHEIERVLAWWRRVRARLKRLDEKGDV